MELVLLIITTGVLGHWIGDFWLYVTRLFSLGTMGNQTLILPLRPVSAASWAKSGPFFTVEARFLYLSGRNSFSFLPLLSFLIIIRQNQAPFFTAKPSTLTFREKSYLYFYR
ncbi:hypothetical protein [Neobacillus mesonae]|uniref:hypothetical protein n=1 Tax=Neobacillus mesonae TaxID=1193713 RepID=UPI00203BCCAD|nr:hypothetical protein [Neobacillus mesonae]MCM3568182.1 hypothetical protein [Neobacillus mesonae]